MGAGSDSAWKASSALSIWITSPSPTAAASRLERRIVHQPTGEVDDTRPLPLGVEALEVHPHKAGVEVLAHLAPERVQAVVLAVDEDGGTGAYQPDVTIRGAARRGPRDVLDDEDLAVRHGVQVTSWSKPSTTRKFV